MSNRSKKFVFYQSVYWMENFALLCYIKFSKTFVYSVLSYIYLDTFSGFNRLKSTLFVNNVFMQLF